MENKEMTPTEKSKELLKAIQFCKAKKLITAEEITKAKSKEEQLKLALKAKLRMDLYIRAHKEE